MYDINKTTTIIVDPFKENQTIEIGYQRDNKAVELEFEGLTGTDNWVCLVWDKKYMYIPIATYKLPIEESYTLASSIYKMQIVKLSENGFKAHSPFLTLKLKVSAPNKYLEEKVPGPFEPAYNIVIATAEAIEKMANEGKFDGADGVTPNLKIGEIKKLKPNENPTVEIVGTKENPVINMGIPQGQTGEIYYPTFEVIGNELIMTGPDSEGLKFVINERGELEVKINE